MPEAWTDFRFTPLDLAAALDAAVLAEIRPGCRAILLWLIEQSPRARVMYAELVVEGEEGAPPLLELAHLLLAAMGKGGPGASRGLVRWIARQTPEDREAMEELEELAWSQPNAPPVYEVHYRRLLRRQMQLRQLLAPGVPRVPMTETDPPIRTEGELEEVWNLALAARSRSTGTKEARLQSLLEELPREPLLRDRRPGPGERLVAFAVRMCGSLEEARRRLGELQESAPTHGGENL